MIFLCESFYCTILTKILQILKKVLSKMKFGEIYYRENCMKLHDAEIFLVPLIFVSQNATYLKGDWNICKHYVLLKDIKGGTKKMILYLIAMWFCHSQVKYHFMRFVIMQKFVTEWVSATYLGFIVISMSWISSLQVTKESNYEMTNERKKKYTKIG